MGRPTGDISHLESIVVENIYIAQTLENSQGSFNLTLELDDDHDMFPIADVEKVFGRYFGDEDYCRCIRILKHQAGEYGFPEHDIPEEAIVNSHSMLPYKSGIVPKDKWDEVADYMED